MFRTTDIVLVAVMVSTAAFTYKTKHDAEYQLAALEQVREEIRQEVDTIDLLQADWSLLTQPTRLQRLAEIYAAELNLEPVDAHQIIEIAELPMAPVEFDGTGSKNLGGIAGSDNTVTGGIMR